jgi:hypothetical protein
MNARLRLALHPKPEPERFDTSLVYTDILFGFVIWELFRRLQSGTLLDTAVLLQLFVGTTLVLGSWIGFRQSLYRPRYQVKFFNLPLFKFIVDQLMLILYFRVAVLTGVDGKESPPAVDLARSTTRLIMYVFVLYFFWDILGVWMAKAKTTEAGGSKKPLYPVVEDSKMTTKEQPVNRAGLVITVFALAVAVVLWSLRERLTPTLLFLTTTALLLVYRLAKEIRTSWKLLPRV